MSLEACFHRGQAMAFCLLAALLAGGCDRPATEPPPQGTPAAAEQVSDETSIELPGAPQKPGYLGVVVARESVDVAAEVAGRVESVVVRPGDRVERGDLVARLDRRELAQGLAMAEASPTIRSASSTRKPPLARCSAPGRIRVWLVSTLPLRVRYSMRPASFCCAAKTSEAKSCSTHAGAIGGGGVFGGYADMFRRGLPEIGLAGLAVESGLVLALFDTFEYRHVFRIVTGCQAQGARAHQGQFQGSRSFHGVLLRLFSVGMSPGVYVSR